MKKEAFSSQAHFILYPPLMEMGFSGVGFTESDTPSDSVVVGLKFGKKIYFEDTPPPPPPPPPLAAVAPPPPASNSRSLGRKGQQQGCQVEGCKVDLSHSKSYYSKHRVCPLHSKTSMVIVSGLHQRFCQQCSRFHQLPEFDQGKRSCRRRLAGHNERRRKPPSGSFSPRYGGVPTIFDNSSSAGGFLVDFSAYARSSTRGPGNQTAAAVKFTPQVWQSNLQDPPPNLYSQGLAVGTDFAGSSSIPSGERFTGITVPDSSCALSLLSNQPWGSRNGASSLGMNNFLDAKDAPLAQPSTDRHGTIANQYANPWSFKGKEAPSSPHQIHPDLCLGQISHSFIGQLSGESELSHQNKTQYMEAEHPRAYHW